jgi:glycosyltransferase involved in cell wall biosynthesis
MAIVAESGDQEIGGAQVIPGVLYISYDGMLEPLGQSQVLAYLERLAPGRRIHLISFEKPADWANDAHREVIRTRIRGSGIEWHPLRYHKTPTAPATAYDIAAGTAAAVAIAARHRIKLVHARSYIAGVMALGVRRATGARFLFDMRGLWADERVDGGLWPVGGTLYGAAKKVERWLLLAADHVVTLSRASEAEIRRFDYLQKKPPPITIIPTCADLDRFRVQGPLQSDPFVLGYIGSVGAWYLLDDMLRCFLVLREQVPRARLKIANRGDEAFIRERLQHVGLEGMDVEVKAVDYSQMPSFIANMTAGMALYQRSYSRVACAPTKLAEYLGCGVPCLGSPGVGDMEEILEGSGVGVVLRGSSEAEVRDGVCRLLELTRQPRLQQACRGVAEELFSLEAGVSRYDTIYNQLGSKEDEASTRFEH